VAGTLPDDHFIADCGWRCSRLPSGVVALCRYLYDQLIKEPIITNSNKARIVEVLRSIAELMIWGDQHNPTFFDYFAEKNILSNFVRILSQKCDNKVKVQIIQTLSILVQNLSNEVSIFYLLSNNYIKSVPDRSLERGFNARCMHLSLNRHVDLSFLLVDA
jgi:hypothetical protein